MGFDVGKAKAAGYTDSEIRAFMEEKGMEGPKPASPAMQEPVSTTPALVKDELPPMTISNTVEEALEKPAVPNPTDDESLYVRPTPEPILRGGMFATTKAMANVDTSRSREIERQRQELLDLADLYKNRHQKYSTGGKSLLATLGGASSKLSIALDTDEMAMEARRDVIELNQHIVAKLKDEGFDTYISEQTGEIMYKDADGNEQEVTSSIMNDLWNSKYENIGAIGGAILGGQTANTLTTPLNQPNPWALGAKAVIVAGGTLIGGGTGAAAGRTLDLFNNSLKLKEELEMGLVMRQAKEAGYYDGVTSVIGGVALKTVTKTGKMGWNAVGKAYNFVLDGNSKAAVNYLKESFNLSDDEAKDITMKFLDTLSEEPEVKPGFVGKMVGQKKRPLTQAEKEILAITSTQEGGEKVMATVTRDNMKVADSMKRTINERSKNLHKLVQSQTDENVGAMVLKDLNAYEKNVKDYYSQVRMMGGERIDGTDFRFDFEKLDTKTLFEQLVSNNKSNPDRLQQLEGFLDDIDTKSVDRTFSGLLDLRQSINDFKYSKLVSKTNKVKGKKTEFDAVNDILNSIDNQINKAAREYMPDTGKEWSKHWQQAKDEYAKMYRVKKNSIVTYAQSKNATEAGIQAKLNRFGNDLDVDARTFNEVMEVLDPKTKMKVENAGISNLVNKYTIGSDKGSQATDFPALAEEVSKLNISTKDGKYLVDTINKLASIYKNDIQLSRVSGGVTLRQTGDNSIATTIEGKAKASLIHQVWDLMQSVNPARNITPSNALIGKLEKVMADPLKQKAVEDYIKAIPVERQAEARDLVKILQVEMTKAAQKADAKATKGSKAFRKMYKQDAKGKLSVSNGALGKGVYLTDSVKNPNPASKVIAHEINTSKMIDYKEISNVLGREVTDKEIRSSALVRKELIGKGYEGITKDNKAMLFQEVLKGDK